MIVDGSGRGDQRRGDVARQAAARRRWRAPGRFGVRRGDHVVCGLDRRQGGHAADDLHHRQGRPGSPGWTAWRCSAPTSPPRRCWSAPTRPRSRWPPSGSAWPDAKRSTPQGRAPQALAGKLRVLERGSDMVLAAHFTPRRPAGPGRPDCGDRAVHPARPGRLPAGPRAGPARGGGVRAHRAARWRRHAAGLTGGDRRRPVAPGTVVERAGRAPLGADGRGVACHGQGGGRTARGRRGTPTVPPPPTSPGSRRVAATARGRRRERATAPGRHG